jgi:thioredoxin reductase (NADPH)
VSNGMRVAVVGAGVAGLTCAAAAAAAGMRVSLFERTAPGGQLNELGEIQVCAGGPLEAAAEVAGRLTEYALNAGAEFIYEEVTEVSRSASGWSLNREHTFSELVVATGTEVDLAPYPDAEPRLGRGVSLCATCDGPLFRGRPVVVAGRGRDADYEADEVRKYASEVLLLRTPEPASADAAPPMWASDPDSARAVLRVIDVDAVTALAGDPLESITYRVGGDSHTVTTAAFFPAGGRVARHERWLPTAASADFPVLIGDAREGSSRTVLEAMGDGARAAAELAARPPQARRPSSAVARH